MDKAHCQGCGAEYDAEAPLRGGIIRRFNWCNVCYERGFMVSGLYVQLRSDKEVALPHPLKSLDVTGYPLPKIRRAMKCAMEHYGGVGVDFHTCSEHLTVLVANGVGYGEALAFINGFLISH